MRVKILTFRYSTSLGGFDDTPLTELLRERELVAFREHFFHIGGVPHLTCVLELQDALLPRDAAQAALEVPRVRASGGAARSCERGERHGRGSAPDPCEGLNEEERALFNHIREWRAERARREGVPPYVILTNKQLVAILRKRPDSLTALGHVEGVGPGKLEHYGAALLELLHGRQVVKGGGSVAETDEDAATEPSPEDTVESRAAGVLGDEAPVAAPTEVGP